MKGFTYVAGLVGRVNSGTISGSYVMGSVDGSGLYVGGLVGGNGGEISSSYATGSVDGGNWVGGLVGRNIASITNSFWDSDINDSLPGVGDGNDEGLTGLPTSRFDDSEDDFTNAGWDFNNVWTIGTIPASVDPSGEDTERPVFQWQ